VGQIYYLKSKRSKAKIYYHTVQEGDTVWMVAQNYGVKQNNLMKMNRIVDSEIDLEVGRVLWLKKTRPEGTSVEYWPETNSGEK
jgi:membrane-bound lytic murein transglycosylase D